MPNTERDPVNQGPGPPQAFETVRDPIHQGPGPPQAPDTKRDSVLLEGTISRQDSALKMALGTVAVQTKTS